MVSSIVTFCKKLGITVIAEYVHSKEVFDILYELDITSLHKKESKDLILNSIGRVKFRTAQPLMFDSYKENRSCGSIILIDPINNETVGAGIIKS